MEAAKKPPDTRSGTRSELDVDERGRPWVIIPIVAVLVAAPLLAVLTRDIKLDALRYFVITQGCVVSVLFAYALYKTAGRALAMKPSPLLEQEISRGHAVGLTTQLMSLSIFIEFSIKRIGHATLDWHTPFLQLLLWLMLLQWIWMERKNWRPLS